MSRSDSESDLAESSPDAIMSYVMLIKDELNPAVNQGNAITSAQMKMAELDAIKKIIVTWRVRWMCREQHSESET